MSWPDFIFQGLLRNGALNYRIESGTALLRVRAVPTKAEEYRARAKEYERVANLLSFGPAKSVVLEMARKCRAMAEQAERDGS
jgi:hypothetical protein